MIKAYQDDLAYIHDVGFGDYARNSAPGLLEILREAQITTGLVVDLGCGSGIWARELSNDGYDVFGIDISPAMIEIARKRVPEADFRVESLLRAKLPECDAVTSLGECLNYLFDKSNNDPASAAVSPDLHRSQTRRRVCIRYRRARTREGSSSEACPGNGLGGSC